MDEKSFTEMDNNAIEIIANAEASDVDVVSATEGMSLDATVSETERSPELALALARYGRMKATEKRADVLARKEQEEHEKQKRRRAERKKAEKKVAAAKEELKMVREFAQVQREAPKKRRGLAAKGLFDLLNMCNSKDDGGNEVSDFSDACDYIGNTEWLLSALKTCTKFFGKDDMFISINRKELREMVFARRDEVKKIIDDTQKLLDLEWNKDNPKET